MGEAYLMLFFKRNRCWNISKFMNLKVWCKMPKMQKCRLLDRIVWRGSNSVMSLFVSYRQKCRADGHPANPPEQSWSFSQHGFNIVTKPVDTCKQVQSYWNPINTRCTHLMYYSIYSNYSWFSASSVYIRKWVIVIWSFVTVEPGNCNGLKETHSNNGASHSEFLQQLHHVGATLSITHYTWLIT